MKSRDPDDLFSADFLATVDMDDPQQRLLVALFRMSAFRFQGLYKEAAEQAETMRQQQGGLLSVIDPHSGWSLQSTVQLGVSAMLAGDFNRALMAFREAQFHVEVPAFAFLTRDALVKSALIHATFGDREQARSLLTKAERLPRTSSWVEAHLDAHRDFAEALLERSEYGAAALDQINFHDIGEMWPFYIVAMHRTMEATGYLDELEHELTVFETLPMSMVEGHGLAGSILCLKRALLALRSGRHAEALQFVQRADPDIAYTQLIEAAVHLYAGRPREALRQATQLRDQTSGLRLLDVRRLSIIASAHFARENTKLALEVLSSVADYPRGLTADEVRLFSPEVRAFAKQRIDKWPQGDFGPSVFLTELPNADTALSEREIVMLQELARGHARAKIAENLFVSINTVKTQL